MNSMAKMVLPGGIDALIGMDILGMGDFAVTHHNGNTVFSFDKYPADTDNRFCVDLYICPALLYGARNLLYSKFRAYI